MSNEGIVMSERDNFEKWYKENERRFHCSHMNEKQIAESAFNAGAEHCKQGEPICSLCNGAGQLQMTNAGPDSEFSECHECDGTGKSNIHPLFAHAMPKSEGGKLFTRLHGAITLFEKNLKEKGDAFRKGDYSNAAFPLTGESAKAYCYAHNSAIQWVLEQLPQLSEINCISPSTTDISELIPEGYTLVPIQPTKAMLDAGAECWQMTDDNAAGYWASMIEASK